MSGVQNGQSGSGSTPRDAGTCSQMSMCGMFARTHVNSISAGPAAWIELPVRTMPDREGDASWHAWPSGSLSVWELCPCSFVYQRSLPESMPAHVSHVPGMNHPTPRSPLPHSPHQPNIGQPRRFGLPGF